MSARRSRSRIRWVVSGAFALLLTLTGAFALGGALAGYPVVPAVGAGGPPVASSGTDAEPLAPDAAHALGAFHVHTVASDGHGTLEEVARAASAAGLSFVVVTDHNVKPFAPHRLDGVLLIAGVEVSTSDGHVVVLGVDAPLPPAPRTGAQAVDWALSHGAPLAVLAHPVQKKNPWKDAAAGARVEGYELYSADTLFRDALARPFSRLLPSAAAWLGDGVHGVLGLVDDQPEVHAAMLKRDGMPVALCSNDAHGRPPYQDVFTAMTMAVPASAFAGSEAQAADAVVQALASGSAFCVFQALGRPDGFSLQVPGDGRRLEVGETVQVTLPDAAWERATLRVWGPGEVTPDGRGVTVTGEGLVQLEVWVDAPGRLFGRTPKPWLVPSPLRVVR